MKKEPSKPSRELAPNAKKEAAKIAGIEAKQKSGKAKAEATPQAPDPANEAIKAEILGHINEAEKLLTDYGLRIEKLPRPFRLAQQVFSGTRDAVERCFKLHG